MTPKNLYYIYIHIYNTIKNNISIKYNHQEKPPNEQAKLQKKHCEEVCFKL